MSLSSVLATEINEVFPNPIGSDNNREFVEIYNKMFINLTGFVIGDTDSNDTLEALVWYNSSYAIIVEEGFAIDTIKNASIYSVGATIGNNLGNNEDTVFLFRPEGVLIDSFSYNNTIEGRSYEKNTSGWFLGLALNGTPGFINSNIDAFANKTDNETMQINILHISSLLPTEAYIHQHITTGFRIDNLVDKNVDAILSYIVFLNGTKLFSDSKNFSMIKRYRTKDTVNLFFEEAGDYTVCGNITSSIYEKKIDDNNICTSMMLIDPSTISCNRGIALFINNTIFRNHASISFSPTITGDYDKIPFVYSYWIEEMNGAVVKKPRNSSNDNKKSWTPNIKKQYAAFVIRAVLTDSYCDDSSPDNNVASAYFIVQGHQEEDGAAVIERIYIGSDGIVKTGDTIRAKIQYYTGNLTKNAASEKKLRVFVKDAASHVASEVSEFAVADSFTSGEITIPISLFYDCKDFPIEETTYTLEVEGFGTVAKKKIPVAGVNKDFCHGFSNGEFGAPLFPSFGWNGTNVTSSLVIYNNDIVPYTYKISSKIYRGPKTYSGDHFANQQILQLNPGSKKSISLNNSLENIQEGEYKIKIQIWRNEQKTPIEFINTFTVVGSLLQEPQQKLATITMFDTFTEELSSDALIYSTIYGNGNYTLLFDGPFQRENRTITINGTELELFTTNLARGKNVFVLRLFEGEELLESKPLILYTNNEGLEDITAPEAITEYYQPSNFAAITGNVVAPLTTYEGSFYRIKNWLNYFIIGILLLFIIFLLSKSSEYN